MGRIVIILKRCELPHCQHQISEDRIKRPEEEVQIFMVFFFVFFSQVNSLLNYSISWHESGSTLAQVMAWCLTAPSHNLNQCWLLISGVLWHSPEGNFTSMAQATIMYNNLKIILLKLLPHLRPMRSLLHYSAVAFSAATISHMKQDLPLLMLLCTAGPCLNIKTVFPGNGIPIIKMGRSWDSLSFIQCGAIITQSIFSKIFTKDNQ